MRYHELGALDWGSFVQHVPTPASTVESSSRHAGIMIGSSSPCSRSPVVRLDIAPEEPIKWLKLKRAFQDGLCDQQLHRCPEAEVEACTHCEQLLECRQTRTSSSMAMTSPTCPEKENASDLWLKESGSHGTLAPPAREHTCEKPKP